MRLTLENFKSLYKSDSTLYSYLVAAARDFGDGVVEVDEAKVPSGPRRADALAWLKENSILTEHDAAARDARETEKAERAAMGKAAISRITQYVNGGVAGFGRLRDNSSNIKKWDDFAAKLPKDVVISPALVDSFIEGHRSVLEWDATPAPAPAPTPEPAVRTLPNGEPELRIDATEHEMRRASIEQLRDLSKRRGEGQSWFNKAGRSAGNIDVGRQWQVR